MQSSTARLPCAERYRVRIHESSLAGVEDAALPPGWEIPPLCERSHQIILAYDGLFSCSVGSERLLIDANQTLFLTPGREYAIGHPLTSIGDAALIITPSAELLDEMERSTGVRQGPAFEAAARPASMALRLMTQHLLRFMRGSDDPLQYDEWLVRTVVEAVRSPLKHSGTSSQSVVESAKEILHARARERVSLGDVAREVGVSPIYLTQEFTRREGLPLYRYARRLRLSSALAELPYCEDITTLALDLGFSSHSHFSEAFRKAFGMPPSEYRATIGSSQLKLAASLNVPRLGTAARRVLEQAAAGLPANCA